ncbi:concanavalin A-like lectin/glucanase domain-containing protein [Cunninghamella echinulata]|nr:concanavalin A-like lectin/glucanase domain-containing protein [Cunninghamella echinulata]
MYSLSFILVAIACIVLAVQGAALNHEARGSCKAMKTDFRKSHNGWKVIGPKNTYAYTKNGLEMKLNKPWKYVRKMDKESGLPFNQYAGEGPTLNYTTYLQYGTFAATMKTTNVGGAITAFIGIANGGDEIDYEILGGNKDNIQSNYFYGKNIVYGANGAVNKIPSGAKPSTGYHNYKITWTPSKITWLIDNKVVRTKERSATKNKKNQYEYPTQPLRIQLGLWDGSTAPWTANWANGPIDWPKQKSPVVSYVRDVTISC